MSRDVEFEEEKLPEKQENKHINCYDIDEEYCIKCGENVESNPYYDRGFNSALDLCRLAIAKDYVHKSKLLDREELARLMTQVSEEKYHGKAFTYNYMIDEISDAIIKAQEDKI